MLVYVAWFLNHSKTRFERWVDQRFPLPEKYRFVTTEDMKSIAREVTLNGLFRDLRIIAMGILIGLAFLMGAFIALEFIR
jgi:hypothetical protein